MNNPSIIRATTRSLLSLTALLPTPLAMLSAAELPLVFSHHEPQRYELTARTRGEAGSVGAHGRGWDFRGNPAHGFLTNR